MSVQLRLPDISGNEREQLVKIRSYLYKLIPELQFALNNIGSGEGAAVKSTPTYVMPATVARMASMDAGEKFEEIKALIIKSADIVDAYYEEINRRLEGVYVAQSDFGVYAQQTVQDIEASSTDLIQRFENLQIIITNHESDIARVEGSIQSIGEDLSYTQQEVLTINSNIETIDSHVATVESEVNSLDTSLQTAKTELHSKVDNTKTELTGMVNEVDEDLQGTKTEVNGRIDDTNGSVANLGAGLNDANSRLAEVDEDLQDSKQLITESIQGVQDRVSGVNALLEDAKAQLKGSIDDLEINLSGLKQAIIGVSAYLKSGLLYTTDAGIPVYGLEIGQSVRDEVAGTEVFKKYARFTSEKLSFYDSNAVEVAYISDKKLFIKMAQITISLQVGGLIQLVMANGDVVEKWVGMGG